MTGPVLALTGGADSPLRDVFGDPDHVARLVAGLACSPPLTGQILGFDGTRLAVWSHPDRLYEITHPAPWSPDQVRTVLAHVADGPAALHPDDVGARTRAALQQARGSTAAAVPQQ